MVLKTLAAREWLCFREDNTENIAMLVQQDAQEQLFYSFRLEDHVPGDHLLRQLDAVLKFERVRSTLASHSPQPPLAAAADSTGASTTGDFKLPDEVALRAPALAARFHSKALSVHDGGLASSDRTDSAQASSQESRRFGWKMDRRCPPPATSVVQSSGISLTEFTTGCWPPTRANCY